MAHILAWALATELAGLAVLPPLRAFFGNRRDAALLSRPIGLTAVAYLGWVLSLATTFGFRRATLLLALAAIAAGGLVLRRRAPEGSAARADWWGGEEKLAATLFWGASGVFLLIRAFGPAILGAEKFMDLAFLNSLARYPAMPPADPWMSGKTINYYYWGYLLAAAQAKLSGVPPMTAFNLAIATFAGSSFAAAACLGLRLSGGRLGVGVGAGFGAVFAGNLTGALDAWSAPFAKDFDYWHASRVIGPESFKTINEFPFFTFFHADLHPHLLAFPVFHRRLRGRAPRGSSGSVRPDGAASSRRCSSSRSSSAPRGPPISGTFRRSRSCSSSAASSRATRGARLPSLSAAVGGALEGAGVLVAALVLFLPYTLSFQLDQRGLGAADDVLRHSRVPGHVGPALPRPPAGAVAAERRRLRGRAPATRAFPRGRRGRLAARGARVEAARDGARPLPRLPRGRGGVALAARRGRRPERRLRRLPRPPRSRHGRRLRVHLLQGHLRPGPAADEHDLQVLPPGLAAPRDRGRRLRRAGPATPPGGAASSAPRSPRR